MLKLKWKKAAAIAAPVVMALAATPADAKVLLLGDGGWEVSFDGLVNGFYSYSSGKSAPTQAVAGYSATRVGSPGQITDGNDYSNITTGLLPVVWGMNIKAPTTNGLDMSARLGIYPQIQNDSVNVGKNNFGRGTQAGAQIDLREAFFEVGGSFGSVLVGRTLSLYQGKNILTDMTLFGVGAPNGGGGGTTLGRIGYGYVYPQFNAAIRYTTPDINGVKASAGIYQPSRLVGGVVTGVGDAAVAQSFNANHLESPRFEGELSYAGDMGGATVSAWFSGMFQKAKTREQTPVKTESWGTAGGLQVGFAGLTLTGSGYWGEGLGTLLMLDLDGFDKNGKGRRAVGYLGQATYAFGQGTNIGVSYGINRQFNTAQDTTDLADGVNVLVRDQSLIDVMVWHEINPNLWIVGEWGRNKSEWQDGVDLKTNTFSVGGFFFW